MKILILGAKGMLGHQLCRVLTNRFEICGTVRGDRQEYQQYQLLPPEGLISKVNAQLFDSVRMAIDKSQPEAIINCIGIVKQRDEAKQAVSSIQVNALFPHQLADLCVERGIRVIQISTDCVFSGSRGNYSEIDVPDPTD